ncbi:tRNA pseudouridine synthase B [endosymbiont of Sipalinus gigas]|uniref:tRNA pseudouridine(55) synthase TruB n=1 Tax=endosymbiont of Sipalinus gigas TaxID=1972134 RepID=UPI000DC6E912|nr:tRNA pseudouridine(55) synthase TruB [endosymbiont of Sipalinus gigas]BBA85378.1 tRNA pseudouridine synthase B [endosymbiont of Sipalinus gigas]
MLKYDENILFLDKPYGWTSNYTLNKIKKIIKKKKYGYIGTLDPLATGMIPIIFDNGTKYFQYILNLPKKYNVIARLGKFTKTYDSESKINIYTNKINFNINFILNKINLFKGKILQKPPIYSSIKINGIRLYNYARSNIKCIIKSRYVKIYIINIISLKNEFLELEITCSKGTYIRSLVNDIGISLGCMAYVYSLRRLSIGNFNKMITISQLINI